MWEKQQEVMTAAIALLNRTVDQLVAAHGGVRPVEQGEGDSFVAAFARAADAVACALDLQRAELTPIRLRIGVHTGHVAPLLIDHRRIVDLVTEFWAAKAGRAET